MSVYVDSSSCTPRWYSTWRQSVQGCLASSRKLQETSNPLEWHTACDINIKPGNGKDIWSERHRPFVYLAKIAKNNDGSLNCLARFKMMWLLSSSMTTTSITGGNNKMTGFQLTQRCPEQAQNRFQIKMQGEKQKKKVKKMNGFNRSIDQAANQTRQEPVAAAAHQNKLSTSILISTKWKMKNSHKYYKTTRWQKMNQPQEQLKQWYQKSNLSQRKNWYS